MASQKSEVGVQVPTTCEMCGVQIGVQVLPLVR